MASKKPTTTKTTKSAPKKTIAAKKTTPRRKTSPVAKSPILQPNSSVSLFRSRQPFKIKRSSLITGIVVIIVIALLFIFRSFFVVATVNGQPISRLALYQELERQGGKQALSGIITKTLILQQAQKQHVTVSQADVDKQVKTIQQNLAKQGQQLDQVLQTQGMTRQSLEEQIKLQQLAEKMVGKNITVTDKEVQDYIDKNKDSLPQNGDENQLKNTVRKQLQSQKQNDAFQAWLGDLQKNAKINYFVNY